MVSRLSVHLRPLATVSPLRYFRYSARCAYLPFSIFFVGKLDLFLGRWTVELVGPGGRAVLKAVKPENLRI